MKKLLSILSVITITGTAMPNVIAASNYEKVKGEILSLEKSKNILCIFDNDNFVKKLRQDVLEVFNLRSYIEKNSSFSTYKIEKEKDDSIFEKQYLTINNKKFEIHNLNNFQYIKTGNQIFLIYGDKIKEIKLFNLNIVTPEELLRNIHSAPNYHMFYNIKEKTFSIYDEKEDNNKNWGWIIETSNGKYSLTYKN